MATPHLPDPKLLDSRIGYQFRSDTLRLQAITHPSAISNFQARDRVIFERLEFLGDSIVGWVVADQLYRQLPDKNEGVLTQLRSRTVSRPALAKAAQALGLNEFLRFGKGEERTDARNRPAMLANAFEALIGAVYLDSNSPDVAREVVLRLLAQSLKSAIADPREVNPKGELQSRLQAIRPELPVYSADENPEGGYLAQVCWGGQLIGQGQGPSKQKAQIAAAADALEKKLFSPNSN